MNMNVFMEINKHKLQIDLVLIEYMYPLLFTCIDELNNMYIVTCYNSDSVSRNWLIASTNPVKVIKLLTNQISIREIFPSNEEHVYIARQEKNHQVMVKEYSIRDVDSKILPTPDIYMDAEDDEFEEEISILSRRVVRQSVNQCSGDRTSRVLEKRFNYYAKQLIKRSQNIADNDDYIVVHLPVRKERRVYA